MSQISVSPAQLKEQAQVYLRSKDEIENAIQQVNRMNDTMAEQWKGQAFKAYIEQYNQLYDNVKKFEQLLEDINKQLNNYADKMEERDREDVNGFGFAP